MTERMSRRQLATESVTDTRATGTHEKESGPIWHGRGLMTAGNLPQPDAQSSNRRIVLSGWWDTRTKTPGIDQERLVI